MCFVASRKNCADDQQQEHSNAIRRLPEAFEQSLLEIDGSHPGIYLVSDKQLP
jgi:hypothetical protein